MHARNRQHFGRLTGVLARGCPRCMLDLAVVTAAGRHEAIASRPRDRCGDTCDLIGRAQLVTSQVFDVCMCNNTPLPHVPHRGALLGQGGHCAVSDNFPA